MELAQGYRTGDQNMTRHSQIGGIRPLSDETLLAIKLPDSQVLRALSRLVFLATLILLVSCIGCTIREFSSSSYFDASGNNSGSDLIDVEILDLLLHDLASKGLIKKSDKALFVNSDIGDVMDNLEFLTANEIDFVLECDLKQYSSFPNSTFDFAFAFGFGHANHVDRLLKLGGVVVAQLNSNLSKTFQKQSNYRIVYVRHYDRTMVALKKTSLGNELVGSLERKQPSRLILEAKKAALAGLEDVLFEPPQKELVKSRNYKFNYLPDLLGDCLENHTRRLFIDVGLKDEEEGIMTWFKKNYPSRNQEFELYHLTVGLEGESRRAATHTEVSNWLKKNVKEDEFVVLKAEADVVEEMIRRRTIGLVDELFLECDSDWQSWGNGKRAYWECVALYGWLIDEGIAVHQWWG